MEKKDGEKNSGTTVAFHTGPLTRLQCRLNGLNDPSLSYMFVGLSTRNYYITITFLR